MDTEKTLDLNKPLFSYSRYERNEYGYGDDFIHRDGDGVDMQVFFNLTLVLLLGIATLTLVSKWKVYAKLGMPGWYSLVPIFSDRKLYENVRGNKENKTLVMAYLIISLLTIAQLATIIIFLNNLVQIFV